MFDLDKLHKELLDIVIYIDDICKNHNINYYITAGTLLGAVRHKGFIPWDDDLDIVMPRRDYENFIEIIKNKNNSDYSILTMSDNEYPSYFSKVQKNGTLFSETKDSNWGIFVDIFPLDDTISKNIWLKIQKKIFEFAVFSRRRLIAKNTSNIFLYAIAKLLPIRTWTKVINHIAKINNNKNGKFYANFGSQYDIYKQTTPKSWYEDFVYLDFEDIKLKAPKEYKNILILLYGNEYMKIPPKNKQITHKPYKIIFSDGSVFENI